MFGSAVHAARYAGSGLVYEVVPSGQLGMLTERAYSGDDNDLDAGIVGNQYFADRALVIASVFVQMR